MSYKLRPSKFWIVILLLLSSIILSFAFPKAKYEGTGFISQLKIPDTFSEWQGKDITENLDLSAEEDRYKFISGALAYEYVNKDGENLLFIVLDAGNFHHPKVCYTSSGFTVKDLKDTEFHTLNSTFKAHTLYTEKGGEGFLSFYWIIIDKKIAHEWIEQKIKQLYFSLFNKKRVGLMVRIDIPAKEGNIKDAIIPAERFISDLSRALPPEEADYIFGGK